MADSADITQSKASDTRHCRMQKVNNLCTYSRPLRSKYCTVAFHTNTAISQTDFQQIL